MVAIPCFNEAATIAKVVSDFKRVLPQASIAVFDNNSGDGSPELAQKAGAHLYNVPRQGKGHVMREIFDHFDDDLLLVVDGDDTYFADDAPLLIKSLIVNKKDMVVGNRLEKAGKGAFKKINLFGNYIIAAVINCLFGTKYRDILSGYRVFSRRFVKNVALLNSGFETEVELTLRALEERLEIEEVLVSYQARPAGVQSKLNWFRDGVRIIVTALMIMRDSQPVRLYGWISLLCFIVASLSAVLRLMNYFGALTLPNAFLAGLIFIFAPIGMITVSIALILSAINVRFAEIKQILRRNK